MDLDHDALGRADLVEFCFALRDDEPSARQSLAPAGRGP
jgi:hypothetical protein